MRDHETIVIDDQKEMVSFFARQKNTDAWVRVLTNELSTLPLENAPLFLDQIMEEHKITVPSEAMEDCMNDMQLMLHFPWDNKLRTIPLRYTALRSLCDRAGISGMSIMCYEDKPYHSPITPKERAETLSMFLQHFKNKALVLVRDDKVSAVMSGDEKEYSIMPVADLLEVLLEKLPEKYSECTFLFCQTSHEITRVTFKINDWQMEKELRDSIGESSVKVDVSKANFILTMITSDIGRNSVTLIPELVTGDVSIRIGEPIKLRHKGCNMDDFREKCGMIYSMFVDSERMMAELAEVKIEKADKVLEELSNNADLPIRSLKRAQELMADECGENCTGFEIYYYMYWICNDHKQFMEDKRKPLSLQQIFDLQEKAARQLRVFSLANLHN